MQTVAFIEIFQGKRGEKVGPKLYFPTCEEKTLKSTTKAIFTLILKFWPSRIKFMSQEDEVFYQGYLLCERFMIEHLYYFRLSDDKLTFWDEKTRKKAGCFHLAISQFAMDEEGRVIKIDSGTAEYILKCPNDQHSFELNAWYKKMLLAQKYAIQRRTQHKVSQGLLNLQDRNLSEDIIKEVNNTWGLMSSIEQLIQSLSERLENNSMLVDYSDKMTNFSRELKSHIERLLISVDEERGTNIFKNTVHRPGNAQHEQSFYSVQSASKFEDDYEEEQRNALPPIEGMEVKVDYANIMAPWKNKQLSEMVLPIVMYEPLSFLQRMTEKFEYSYLLSRADTEKDPGIRLAYVIAFAICPFYRTRNRMRLSFEPIRGQTFNYLDERSQVKISCEATQPGYCMQQLAECRSFHFNQHTRLVGKFYGNNFEFKFIGPTSLQFKSNEEVIEYNRPHLLVRNIMTNNPFIELTGQLRFKNDKLKIKAEVVFKGDGTTFTGNIYEVDRTIKWTIAQDKDGVISVSSVGSKKKIEIWRPNDKEDVEPRFGLSKYALQLNHIPFHMMNRYSETDSRMRSDIRLLEQGKIQNSDKLRKNITKETDQELQNRRLETLKSRRTKVQLDNDMNGKELVPYQRQPPMDNLIADSLTKLGRRQSSNPRMSNSQRGVTQLIKRT